MGLEKGIGGIGNNIESKEKEPKLAMVVYSSEKGGDYWFPIESQEAADEASKDIWYDPTVYSYGVITVEEAVKKYGERESDE